MLPASPQFSYALSGLEASLTLSVVPLTTSNGSTLTKTPLSSAVACLVDLFRTVTHSPRTLPQSRVGEA